MHTDKDAREYVETALGEHAAQFDIDAIVDSLYECAGSWDFRQLDHDVFWSHVI